MSEPVKLCPFCESQLITSVHSSGVHVKCPVSGCWPGWKLIRNESEPTAHPLPSALAGVTPEMARKLGEAADHIDRAAAILRALADSIEKTEAKP